MAELPNAWEDMLLLPEKWQAFLHARGETGMGYTTGDVVLKDGSVFRDVVFMNPYLGGVRGRTKGDIPFSTDEIEHIEVTHKRWQWEW